MMKKNWVYRRGDIYCADLNPVIGSEQGGTRPVVVIQNDTGNKHAPTLIVATVTSKIRKKEQMPTHYLIKSNPAFAEDIKSRIGKSVDVSAIEAEIANYRNELRKTERNKANLERDMDNISDDDKNAERKRKDMNRRLDSLYEKMNQYVNGKLKLKKTYDAELIIPV